MFYHKLSKAILVVAFLFVFTGAFIPSAKAATIEELQAQITALLAQIAQLQQQLAALQGGGTTWCHTFNQNLGVGMSGPEVTALQTALQKQGLYTRTISGYFDQYTASAVVAFQEKYASEVLAPWGLTHGTGYVATTTRAKLNKLYGCGVITKPYIQVLSPNGGETWEKGNTYNINWSSKGLSSDERLQINIQSRSYWGESSSCRNSFSVGFLSQSGTYSWTIPSDMCIDDYKVKICDMEDASWQIPTCDESDNYFSIVSAGANLPPVIDGLTAPSQLKVNETGTWTIKAHDPENGVLTYSVDWGDNLKTPLSSSATGTQTTTFTHSYNQVGTYTITFTVTDDKYQTARTTTTVNVVSTTTSYITVISPNGGEIWEIGKTYQIKWESQGLDKVDIRVVNPNTSPVGVKIITGIQSSLGSYFWTISSSIFSSRDDYEVSISGQLTNGTVISDQSDSRFSIVPAAPTTCTDTDGGWTYYVKGSAIGYGGVTVADSCCTDLNDSSCGKSTGSAVSEAYCSGTTAKSVKYNCPYGCENGACKSGITVTSPNGGETLVRGNTYDITWTCPVSVSKVNISLQGPTSRPIATGVVASLHRYSWTVPNDVGASSNYKILIKDADSSVDDYSDNYFTITSPTAACTDSDGGQNYYTQGTGTGLYGTYQKSGWIFGEDPNRASVRYDSNLTTYSIFHDHCVDSATSNQLNEGYCDSNGVLQSYGYPCPYGCENGACKYSTTSVSDMSNQLASVKEELLRIAEELKKVLGM